MANLCYLSPVWDNHIRAKTGYDWHGTPGFARFLLDIHRVPGRTFIVNEADDIRLGVDDDFPDAVDDDSALSLPADKRAKTIGTVYSIMRNQVVPFAGWCLGWGMRKLVRRGGFGSGVFGLLIDGRWGGRTWENMEVVLGRAAEAGVLPKSGLASLIRPNRFFEVFKTLEPVWYARDTIGPGCCWFAYTLPFIRWHMALGMSIWVLASDFVGLWHMDLILRDRDRRTISNSSRRTTSIYPFGFGSSEYVMTD